MKPLKSLTLLLPEKAARHNLAGATGMRISRRRLKQLMRDYQPLLFESFSPTDRRYSVQMHHVLKNYDRFWVALRTAARYVPLGPLTVADLGTYPGSLLRLLRRLVPSEACRLVGVGLMISDEFRQTMAEDCGADILTVNLDPKNDQLKGKGYPTRIPLDDGTVEFAFALEVIEHMVSPSHLLAEAFRILAPGGYLLATTPNVTRIGNVFKLLVGHSNFDRLIPLDYEHPEDEWRPHFREYTLAEVCESFQRAGFQVVEARHFLGEDTRYNMKTISQQLINLAKCPFYVVPHLRGCLLAVGRKPVKGNR
ncbi:MAG: methyltransferase domain-containing protein [candidate division NC10 bacterium]|nr:methyltransferase domain-containing protein [candidate division NC10 bacterium]